MKIFLLLTLSLCAVQCSDVLIKVIQEAHIGNCKLGCNQCPQDGNTGNNTLALAQAKLTKLKVEQKELEEDVSEAETAESSVNSAGNATEDLTNAVQGTGRRRRRKRASDTVSLTSCEDPSAKLEGEVGTVILKVMTGIKKSLEAISENNLNITTLNCYIVLAVDLTNRLKTGTLNKPSDVSAIVTFSVTVQISVTTTRTTVVVIVTKRKEALVEKKQEVAAAKKEVVDAGGTVEETPSTIASTTVTPVKRRFCDGECGRSTVTVPRIVGGQEAKLHEYPWQVNLNIEADVFASPATCGASIIKKSWILSAAHCFVNPYTFDTYSNLKVVATLAEHDTNNMTETESITIAPNYLYVHDDYKTGPNAANSEEHDIALLYLGGTLTFGTTVKPLCMPRPEDYVAEKEVVATGWGVTDYGGNQSNTLQEVGLNLKSPEDCKTLNDNAPETQFITDNMICALGQNKDACQGDSGGPLITLAEDGRWVQLGIVSFGYKCAEPNVPGFYTKLVNYVDWIENVTRSSDC